MPRRFAAEDDAILMSRKVFGQAIAQLRRGNGLSQDTLARAVGMIGKTDIAGIESGRARLRSDRLPLWAAALGVDARQLATFALSCYEPSLYRMVFGPEAAAAPVAGSAAPGAGPAPPPLTVQDRDWHGQLRRFVARLAAEGTTAPSAIADALNRWEIPRLRGDVGRWTRQDVIRLLRRLDAAEGGA